MINMTGATRGLQVGDELRHVYIDADYRWN